MFIPNYYRAIYSNPGECLHVIESTLCEFVMLHSYVGYLVRTSDNDIHAYVSYVRRTGERKRVHCVCSLKCTHVVSSAPITITTTTTTTTSDAASPSSTAPTMTTSITTTSSISDDANAAALSQMPFARCDSVCKSFCTSCGLLRPIRSKVVHVPVSTCMIVCVCGRVCVCDRVCSIVKRVTSAWRVSTTTVAGSTTASDVR
jgi:hypothetical protein